MKTPGKPNQYVYSLRLCVLLVGTFILSGCSSSFERQRDPEPVITSKDECEMGPCVQGFKLPGNPESVRPCDPTVGHRRCQDFINPNSEVVVNTGPQKLEKWTFVARHFPEKPDDAKSQPEEVISPPKEVCRKKHSDFPPYALQANKTVSFKCPDLPDGNVVGVLTSKTDEAGARVKAILVYIDVH